MNPESTNDVLLVEATVQFTLLELSRVCGANAEHIVALVDEGVLTPRGESPEHWIFSGVDLRRARMAVRLLSDLRLNAPGAALALDLLAEIEALKSELRSLSR